MSSSPRSLLKASRFNAMRVVAGSLLLSNSFTGSVIGFTAEEMPSIRRLLRGPVSSEGNDPLERALIENGFLVPVDRDELRGVDDLHAALNDERSFELVLLPTEACNFRCTYCYESFLRGAMSDGVVADVVALVARLLPRLESLHVAWFGGEPLLAFPTMRAIGEQVRAACAAWGVDLRTSITTNGALLDAEKLAFLEETSCRHYQVTLDGVETTHDQTRPAIDGGATFDSVWAALRLLKTSAYEHRVVVRANVHAGNLASVETLVERFAAEFGEDERFTLDFHTVWEGSAAPESGLKQLLDREPTLERLRNGAVDRTGRDCLGFTAFGAGARYCYSARSNALVVGADGTLYKCTLAFHDARNHVGKLTAGGILEIDEAKFSLWTERSDYRSDERCKSCFHVPTCVGAFCPFTRISEGSRACPPEKESLASTFRTASAIGFADALSPSTNCVTKEPEK